MLQITYDDKLIDTFYRKEYSISLDSANFENPLQYWTGLF